MDNLVAAGEMRHLSLCSRVRAGYSGSLHISSSLRINYIMFQWLHLIQSSLHHCGAAFAVFSSSVAEAASQLPEMWFPAI